jgi:hypothetical protein
MTALVELRAMIEEFKKAGDSGDHWVTINGQKILIGADGKPKGGNPKVYGGSKKLSGKQFQDQTNKYLDDLKGKSKSEQAEMHIKYAASFQNADKPSSWSSEDFKDAQAYALKQAIEADPKNVESLKEKYSYKEIESSSQKLEGSDKVLDIMRTEGSDQELDKQYATLAKTQNVKLTTSEKSARDTYSEDNFTEINDGLRGGGRDSEGVPVDTKLVSHLDSAISKATLPDAITLYRGAVFSPKEIKSMTPGKVISDKAYVSTSISAKGAAGFANDEYASGYKESKGRGATSAILSIQNPKGSTGLVMNHGNSADEREVLLPRDAKLQVVSASDVKIDGVKYRAITLKRMS